MKILVLYYNKNSYPLIRTNSDMLYCFEQYTDAFCFYINVAYRFSSKILEIEYDLIVYHDLLLCKRSSSKRFDRIIEVSKKFIHVKGYKIALVQDEFMKSIMLNNYLEEQRVKLVFSTADKKDREFIYKGIMNLDIKFVRFLTGYVDFYALNTIKDLEKENIKKNIDIGYRASYDNNYALGRHGLLKGEIADKFLASSSLENLVVDVSTKMIDSKRGLDWYRFLLASKYTLGVESGASLLDEDGSIEKCVMSELLKNSNATFEEVENVCFKGVDGNLGLFAIGPRHFEAIMAKTCQILVEGDYNGILKPWEHYIPLKKDFSNLSEVIRIVKNDELREGIVERAYKDVVVSGKYTYQSFIDELLIHCDCSNKDKLNLSSFENEIFLSNKRNEQMNLRIIKFRSFFFNYLLKLIPSRLFKLVDFFYK